MMKLKKRLFIGLVVVILAIAGVFGVLIHFNDRITKETTSEISALYMSEMMYQLRDHFGSIIRFKNKEASYIAQHAVQNQPSDLHAYLIKSAGQFGFDYIAFCDASVKYEMIMGEPAWFRNLTKFIEQIKAGEL